MDEEVTWRIVYRLDADAVVVLEVFSKKTKRTPSHIVENCRARLKRYESEAGES